MSQSTSGIASFAGRRLLSALLGLALLAGTGRLPAAEAGDPAPPPPVNGLPEDTRHLRVGIVPEHTTVRPGSTVSIGVLFEIEEHWHVYWTNAGEAGFPPSVIWTLPAGWEVGPLQFPTPVRLKMGPLVTYGYEGSLLLAADLKVPAGAAPGPVTLSAKVDWLVCHEECDEGDAARSLTLEVSADAPAPTAHQPLFEAMRALMPRPLPASTGASLRRDGKALELIVTGDGPWSASDAEVYVYALQDGEDATVDHVVGPSEPQVVERSPGRLAIRMQLQKRRRNPTVQLTGILSVERGGGRQGFWFDVPVQAPPEVAPTPSGPSPVPPTPEPPPAEPKAHARGDEPVPAGFEKGPIPGAYSVVVLPTVLTSSTPVVEAMAGHYKEVPEGDDKPLWLLLLGALVGGIVLNIMPCVLPVLSIKVLGFVSQADEKPIQVRRHAYAFAIGVLASFWVLAGLILALRAGGEQLGWGFHFQSPIFVVGMAVLMFAVGVNLAGVFEIGLGVQTLAGDAASRIHASGYASSFWSGALATVIATPCTAPMMGPAVGYAMTAPVVNCILIFTALGVGMALPYVLLSMSPRLLKKMPRPGPWMETFKHALAFPMFATVIWLGFVLADHVGAAGVLWMFMGLLVLALGLWIYGTWGTPSTSTRKRWIVGYGFALLCVLGCGSLLHRALQIEAPAATAGESEGGIDWEPWSKERIAWRLSQGQTVFVDFTAKWCVSCLAQEQAFIDTPAVHDAIRQNNVAMLKADWTRRDDKIRKGLAEFGRSSVPLYVVYKPLKATPPPPPK